MPTATQFCVGLGNQPGTLAKLCAALARAHVNIDAIAAVENADCCWVRFVASPAPQAKTALKRGKFNFCTQTVLALKAANEPGVLGRIAGKLGRAGININYVYGSGAPGPGSLVVLSVADPERAAQLVR
jgi:hypothetical protein